MAKPALGRGLGALLGGASEASQHPKESEASQSPSSQSPSSQEGAPASQEQSVEGGGVPSADQAFELPIAKIYPSSLQPRQDYPTESLQELADSIREQGIIQPLIVRQRGEGYELIAGERRWRAAQQAGLTQVPVIIRETDDHSVLELMLVENLQREDLNAVEEAQGYNELMERFQLRQEEVAVKVGKSRAAVANALRLLKLSPEVQRYLREGTLSVGHAKAILGLGNHEAQDRAAELVVKRGLSVRNTEELINQWGQKSNSDGSSGKGDSTKKSPQRDAHVANLESQLRERFGTKVNLRYRQGKGAVEIRFFSDQDLERILELVGVRAE